MRTARESRTSTSRIAVCSPSPTKCGMVRSWKSPPWGGKACLGLASSSAIGPESVAHSNKWRMARCRRWPPPGLPRRPHIAGPFRDVVNVYAQANLLQIMQCTACNALHNVTQRCCRWLLQTRDRVDDDTFSLKQEFLAVMLGVHRPTVTVVLRTLQQEGLISSRYGRIQILASKATRSGRVRVLRRHPGALRASRTVTHG